LKRAAPDARASASQQLLLAFESPPAITFITPQVPAGNERRVSVAQQVIVYRLQRARRRTIGFQVNELGLTVRAPRWIAMREIEAAIVQNQRWILKKQIEWRASSEQRRLKAIRFADGGQVQYLGNRMQLRLGADVSHSDDVAQEIRLAIAAQASEAGGTAGTASMAAAAGASRYRRAARALQRPHRCALCRLASVVGANAVGLMLARWSSSAQLALGSLRVARHRLRHRPRIGSSARAEPQSTFLARGRANIAGI